MLGGRVSASQASESAAALSCLGLRGGAAGGAPVRSAASENLGRPGVRLTGMRDMARR
jgi:hypothetical protein